MADKRRKYVLLSLGANLGSPRKNIGLALKYLHETGTITAMKVSSDYITEPVGYKEQPDFVNIAVSGFTDLSVNMLIETIKSIEYSVGRIVRERWHGREVDIDILLYDHIIIENENCTIPHPRMHQRKFVLEPAAEIASDAVHPKLGKTINELLAECRDTAEVKMLA